MKARYLFLIFLCVPFVANGMKVSKKVDSPYLDSLRVPTSRPGSPALLEAVSEQLRRYKNAYQTVEAVRDGCKHFKFGHEHIDTLLDKFHLLLDNDIKDIMITLYWITQKYMYNKKLLTQKLANLLRHYILP